MSDFLTALGLVLVIEGALYALFPTPMRKVATQVLAQPDNALRTAGLISAAVGFIVVWLVRAG
ncbi:MAG: DUF2065 domain-containing protein [Pseudomonadota bacterium]